MGYAPGAPVPPHTTETEPFWKACREGKLLLSECLNCTQKHFCRESRCPKCGSTSLGWLEASGNGSLHSYVIAHQPRSAHSDETPHIIAIIQLSEGPQVMSLLDWNDRPLDELRVGIPVKVVFGDNSETGRSFGFVPC